MFFLLLCRELIDYVIDQGYVRTTQWKVESDQLNAKRCGDTTELLLMVWQKFHQINLSFTFSAIQLSPFCSLCIPPLPKTEERYYPHKLFPTIFWVLRNRILHKYLMFPFPHSSTMFLFYFFFKKRSLPPHIVFCGLQGEIWLWINGWW